MNNKLEDKANEIMLRANEVKKYLQKYSDCPKNKIDEDLFPVRPYIGNGDIKLIIVGQDPTLRNIKKRQDVKFALMLNEQNNNLRKYVDCICKQLGCELDNVYATNLFKFFYTHKPTDTPFDVLEMHLPKNLQLLKDEITGVFEVYPECQIITLGEPVLKLLVNSGKVDDKKKQMKYYWGYVGKDTDGCFHRSEACENKLGRVFYPFIHQLTYVNNIGDFYKGKFDAYAKWMKMCIE